MKKASAIKLALLCFLPILIHFCMSSLYGACRALIMESLSLATFDPYHFDANDLTRWYFAILALSTTVLSVFISVRHTHNRNARSAIIGVIAVILFYLSGLFCQGMMLK